MKFILTLLISIMAFSPQAANLSQFPSKEEALKDTNYFFSDEFKNRTCPYVHVFTNGFVSNQSAQAGQRQFIKIIDATYVLDVTTMNRNARKTTFDILKSNSIIHETGKDNAFLDLIETSRDTNTILSKFYQSYLLNAYFTRLSQTTQEPEYSKYKNCDVAKELEIYQDFNALIDGETSKIHRAIINKDDGKFINLK